jgi:tRNA(fMet)-specific endonuclease VapC
MIFFALDTNIVLYFLKGDITIIERMELENKGIQIGDDVLIAAYCIKHNLPLVTNNTKHFKDIDNLQTINWKE